MTQITDAKIIELIKKVSPAYKMIPIEKNTNLFTNLILDSLAIINLIIVLEEEFSFTFDYADFKPDTFLTVQKIEELLKRVCPHLTGQ